MDIEHIKEILKQLDNLYKEQSDNSQYNIPNELVCKMATLELCGWLEECFDNLVVSCDDTLSDRLFGRDKPSSKHNLLEVIKEVHGLSYKNHFKKLLISLVGNSILLMIEEKIGRNKIDQLSSELGSLHKQRNELAHKSSKVIQQQFLDAPSKTLQKLQILYPTLQEFEKHLKSLEVTLANTD